MPTGYSFNLDGTTLYLAMASVFVAQAAEATTGQHMGFGRQIRYDVDSDDYFERRRWRAARSPGDFVGNSEQFYSQRPWRPSESP